MPRIEAADGTALYVKDWGSGRPVVLIHGWPLNADSWEHQAYHLARAGHRVIAYDRRGFGRSEQPWTGYDYDTLSDDLAAVIDALGLQDAALVGFSMGGGEVARYMSRHQGRGVRKAALLGSIAPYLVQAPDNPDGAPKEMLQGMQEQILKDRPEFLKGFFRNFYGQGLLSGTSEGVLHWSLHMALLASVKATVNCIDAWQEDFRPDLAAFDLPTLVIHGTSDAIVPIDPTGRAAARMIPQARLIEYDGAPHGFLATHAERATQDLLDFLA
ncbi:alpha/beta fold hydrolase [Rubellimicrobium aerolatum]|uniref:Alpha/beta fold hydrolase n=1 Tax=Rubellimicrobium aerolatum TaxID=490979 RepID=A0ABW0SEI0_9RHOB|nr:alpha/beta hydrolase [Rubellimicrobium aerolatum]MBP1805620.1 pimeloyl-ACP methyl ester carboxylesterase [Rubellimicrobium aerolatum]